MKRTFVFCEIGGGESVANYHIGIAVKNLVHHVSSEFCRICVVTVYH